MNFVQDTQYASTDRRLLAEEARFLSRCTSDSGIELKMQALIRSDLKIEQISCDDPKGHMMTSPGH